MEACFVDGSRGKLFVLTRRPERASGVAVLVVPPFAEEMNKSRAMLADTARRLAERGVATVLPDLFGTGDSEGEFREADWETWKHDLARVAEWAAGEGLFVDCLLCVRLGCVLGAEFANARAMPIRRAVFWQPVLEGRIFTTQFLRLRVAASMMGDQKETVSGLRELLGAGATVEVAGYELARRLVDQIDGARLLDALGPKLGQLHWVELMRDAELALPNQSVQAVAVARELIPSVTTDAMAGEPFWSSTEIVRLPALVDRTISALVAP